MQESRVGKRPIRSLSIPEKMDAITRVRSGESKASVARDIGVPESTLRGWCKAENKIRSLANRGSSPHSNPTSPASSNSTEPVVNQASSLSSGEDDDLGRAAASKRRRLDKRHAVPSTSSYSPPHNSEHVEITPKIDYMNNLINSLMNNGRSDNTMILQQLAAQNAAHLTKSFLALQGNGMTNTLIPQAVGLVENGLQYTRSNNGHLNKRHSLASASHYSAIAPTTQMDTKASRKSLPAAAEAPATPVPASPRKTNEYQNGVIGQQQAYQMTTSARSSKKDGSTTTATTRTANTNGTTSTSNSNGLFQKSDEALWLWLAQQQHHILGQQPTMPTSFSQAMDTTGSWFWQWYKQCSAMAGASQLSAPGAGSSSGRSTPTRAHRQQTTSTPLALRSPTKAKAVLDRILYSNNNNNYNNYNDEMDSGARRTLDLSNKTAEGKTATEPSEAAAGFDKMTNDEAILHGQKFATWLANASDPAITQLYVLQIQYLLNRLTTERPSRAFKHSRK